MSQPTARRWQHLTLAVLFALSLILALLALAGWTLPARAASFVVTKTADTADGACDADCSLREAIIAANDSPGADIITMPAGVYVLNLAGSGEDRSATGDLDILGDLSLLGAGPAQTVIDAAGLRATPDRVLDIPLYSSPIGVHISGVTIRNGHPALCGQWEGWGSGIRAFDANLTLENVIVTENRTPPGCNNSGGGIFFSQQNAEFPASLTITGTQIISNTAAYGGGGIYVHQYWSVAAPLTITLTNSSVMSNTAESGTGPAFGGGINISGDSETHPTTLSLQNSTVAGNRAYGTEGGGGAGFAEGGGIRFTTGNSGGLSIIDSTVSDNSALGNNSSYIISTGGGVHYWNHANSGAHGALRIENSVIERNVSHSGGGLNVLMSQGSYQVISTSIRANQAAAHAGDGGRYGGGSGGGISVAPQADIGLRLSGVTLRGNTAAQEGGGIYGTLYEIADSQIVSNTAAGDGGGLAGGGTLLRSTVTGNRAANGGGLALLEADVSQSLIAGNSATEKGGGISVLYAGRDGPTIKIHNSTISANQAGQSAGISHGGPVYKLCQGGSRDGNHFQYGYGGKMLLDNTTIAANVSPTGTGGIRVNIEDRDQDDVQAIECPYPGFVNWGTGSDIIELKMVNVLVAANSGDNCTAIPAGASQGHNLSDDGSCLFTSPGDIVKVDAKVGSLQDNGGSTLTHALLAGSPAIDTGDAANCPATDQRGVSRPQGPACDIGAYEWQPTSPHLQVAPTSLAFTAVACAAPPAGKSVAVTNTGAGTLNWTTTKNQAWLGVAPAAGAAPANPLVTVNQAGLPVGTHTGAVTFAAAGAGGSPRGVNVTLSVLRDSDLVRNGGFEAGPNGDWTESSTHFPHLIRPASELGAYIAPHGGNWAALMGVQNGEVSELTQSVLVPPGVTTLLKYWYYISSPESNCTYDSALIQVNGTTVKTHPLCQTGHTAGWTQASVPLTAYAGQQVTLRVRVANDALSDPSVFMLDDVRLAIDPPCTVTTATPTATATSTPTGTRVATATPTATMGPPPVYDNFVYLPTVLK